MTYIFYRLRFKYIILYEKERIVIKNNITLLLIDKVYRIFPLCLEQWLIYIPSKEIKRYPKL